MQSQFHYNFRGCKYCHPPSTGIPLGFKVTVERRRNDESERERKNLWPHTAGIACCTVYQPPPMPYSQELKRVREPPSLLRTSGKSQGNTQQYWRGEWPPGRSSTAGECWRFAAVVFLRQCK